MNSSISSLRTEITTHYHDRILATSNETAEKLEKCMSFFVCNFCDRIKFECIFDLIFFKELDIL